MINGKNITQSQRERWAGDYPITVLEEALNKLSPRLGFDSLVSLVNQYPEKIINKKGFESILEDIGTEILGFKAIRDEVNDFTIKYGFPPIEKGQSVFNHEKPSDSQPDAPPPNDKGDNKSGKEEAFSTTDPKAVIKALKKFKPKGDHREKIVTLLKEASLLKINKHPHCFVFLLRSMFELSAKAYCKDHEKDGGPTTIKDGKDKTLVVLLKDIHKHLTKNEKDPEMVRLLHGAMVVIAEPTNFISVTSMNQLIHNPNFSIDEPHICTLFFNVFTFLKAMNQ